MFPYFSLCEPLTFPVITVYMYLYESCSVSVNVLDFCCLLFWHRTSCSNSILCCFFFFFKFHVSSLMFSPLLCVSVHVPVLVTVRACTCTCVHATLPDPPCCRGAPEEEGRPRRRRTPRFLLKPWTGCRQATESRRGLQVNATRRDFRMGQRLKKYSYSVLYQKYGYFSKKKIFSGKRKSTDLTSLLR